MLLVDAERAASRARKLRAELPGVGLFYAYKCFGHGPVVRALDPWLEGFTVASAQECRELVSAGIAPGRLLFANPVKIPDHIAYAERLGVLGYAFQSRDEVDKLARLAPGARVQCRVRVPDDLNVDGQRMSAKFGADPGIVRELVRSAAEAGLRPFGLTFHVGSQSTVPKLWNEAIRICAALIEDLRTDGIALTTLDLGGGFPVDYRDEGDDLLEAVTAEIRAALDDHLTADVEVIAEPGRSLVADSAVIMTSVIGRETRDDEEWLYLDTGVFQSLLETLEFGRLLQPIVPLDRPGESLGAVHRRRPDLRRRRRAQPRGVAAVRHPYRRPADDHRSRRLHPRLRLRLQRHPPPDRSTSTPVHTVTELGVSFPEPVEGPRSSARPSAGTRHPFSRSAAGHAAAMQLRGILDNLKGLRPLLLSRLVRSELVAVEYGDLEVFDHGDGRPGVFASESEEVAVGADAATPRHRTAPPCRRATNAANSGPPKPHLDHDPSSGRGPSGVTDS